jgi:hypothetical protein
LTTVTARLSRGQISNHLLQALLPHAGKIIRREEDIREILGLISGYPLSPVVAIVGAVEHAKVFPVESLAAWCPRFAPLLG